MTAAPQQTTPVSVANPAFLLERLAADCAPLQEYRELTRNAVDAIVRRCRTENRPTDGLVLWDVDWALATDRGVYKLCCIDTGIGMSGAEIEKYINHLSSSSSAQGLDANFGIGARITAGHNNPAGLYYFSWQAGSGVMAHFWRDDAAGAYGLKCLPGPDGRWGNYTTAPAGTKPEEIAAWGTKVVLGGDTDIQHTVLPPDVSTLRGKVAAPGGMKWLTNYLNRRFFRFPEGVLVRVRELSSKDPDKWPTEPATSVATGAQLRKVEGAKHYLDENAEDCGRVEVEGAVVHWWLLRETTKGGSRSLLESREAWESRGHVAALYQDELYELRRLQEGYRILKMFGITFGFERVVIYVEPQPAGGHVLTANTARSHLRLNGDELPWVEWAAEFRGRIPSPLRKMMEDLLAATGGKDHLDAIKRRLQTIAEFIRVERYRRAREGRLRISGDAVGGDSSHDDTSPKEPGGTRGKVGGARGNLYGTMLDPDGEVGVPVNPRPNEPQVYWVSRAGKPPRAEGEIEDRAANYDWDNNVLKINADFRVITTLKQRFLEDFGDAPGGEEIVSEVVHEWIEQQLIEAVMGVRTTLEGNRLWAQGSDELKRALSEEALTVAIMPRYHMIAAIKRQLASRLPRARSSSPRADD